MTVSTYFHYIFCNRMKNLSYFRRQLKDDLVIVEKISRLEYPITLCNVDFCKEPNIIHSIMLLYRRTNKSMAFVRLGQRSMRHPPVGCP